MSKLKLAVLCTALFTAAAVGHAAPAPVTPSAPVVGGTTVPAGKYPSVVAVELDGGWCSGTLIAPDVVLTAGHCVDAGVEAVFVGTLDYGKPGGTRIPVVEATAYPNWERSYDVGVLVLARPAEAEPTPIAAACTAKSTLVTGHPAQLVGYGLTDRAGEGNNSRLHEATLAITDPTCELDAACEGAIAPNGEFAAGGRGTDACFGDSGGPVFASAPSGLAVLGVVSRGMAVGGAPCGGGGIYVRADKVATWLQKVTGRTIARASCTAPAPAADAPGEGAADSGEGAAQADESGGCNAAGGTGLAYAGLLGVGVLALIARRRAAPRAVR